ncbi:MAG: bifunctional phosphoribosyl-AMP cyclohydrolase/phosphoribosyl-ATP diphosphatase HisIE [Calditrichia bacterium]
MVIASIDLMDGKAVQLKQGAEKVLEVENPLDLAKRFNRYGEVAIIDLDAALGNGNNKDVIKPILKAAECRVGGGIKTVEQAKEWISLGARKVIIGSKAFENDAVNHKFLQELADAVSPQHIIIAIDARNGEIVTKGWKHRTGLDLLETVPQLDNYCTEFLFTCVEREGMMQGSDHELIHKLLAKTTRRVTVAGGVSTLNEVRELAMLGTDQQLGMALYTGKIDLADSFIESLNWRKSELLPTIVQDRAGQVLMLAYSNRESLRQTFATGNMHYFSRSRNQLWQKGETSGHFQRLHSLRTDCDQDTLLAIVDQTNVACHRGDYSCFGDRNFSWLELYDVIADRFENSPEGSYTAKLKSGDLLSDKILEEAQEVVEAEERDHLIWEAADLLFFLTAKLVRHNIGTEEVLHELRRRRKK